MGSAYTPGLKVTRHTVIEKTRRLPIRGETLVEKDAVVAATDVVARAELPGNVETVRLDQDLGIEPVEVKDCLKVAQGDAVTRGQVLGEIRAFFGLFKSESKSPCDGTVDFFSEVTGHLGIRRSPVPVNVDAYIDGVVADIIPNEGVTVRCHGAIVQGIFGVGGEGRGEIRICASSPEDELRADDIPEDVQGKIVVGGALARLEAFKRAAELGAVGFVTGGIVDRDLSDYLGYDIGVAVTGHEEIPITIVVTEGFGRMTMAKRTFDLLSEVAGRTASLNGATQIRAGAMRPEIIIPEVGTSAAGDEASDSTELAEGTPIRVIRVPYFGILGKVVALPHEPVTVETGAKVRVLEAELSDGRRVTVPRANVEIIQT